MDTKAFNERNFGESRAVCERIEREDAERRGKLSERERQILDMWPRFEDGVPVLIGDEVLVDDEDEPYIAELKRVGEFMGYTCAYIAKKPRVNAYPFPIETLELKRPAPKVLDADGVEIKFGDTVWDGNGVKMIVMRLVGELPGHVTTHSNIPPAMHSIDPKRLTHTRPDSWKRLEKDAAKGECDYFGFSDKECAEGDGCPACDDSPECHRAKIRDIIRRAKALQGWRNDPSRGRLRTRQTLISGHDSAFHRRNRDHQWRQIRARTHVRRLFRRLSRWLALVPIRTGLPMCLRTEIRDGSIQLRSHVP